MASTKSTTLQTHHSLLRHAQVSNLADEMWEKLMTMSRATLEIFETDSSSGGVSLPDADDAKTFVQESSSTFETLRPERFQNAEDDVNDSQGRRRLI